MRPFARAIELLVAVWNRSVFGFKRRQLERELATEMQFHEQMLIRDYIAEGMCPDAARAAARRRLGNTLYFGEQSRDAWGFRWLDELVQDIRFGVRSIRRHPAISSAVILTLALAIGANTAVFSAINVVLLRSVPLPSADRLTYLSETQPGGESDCCFTEQEIEQLRQNRKTIEQLGYWDLTRLNVAIDNAAQPADGWLVSGNFFDVVSAHAEAGRLIAPADDAPGAPAVAVISHSLWQRRFGGEYSAIGHTISLDGSPITVIGVLPKEFTLYVGRVPPDVFVPKVLHPRLALADHDEYHVVGRLAPEATHATAGIELTQAWRRVLQEQAPAANAAGVAERKTRPRAEVEQRAVMPTIHAVPATEAAFALGNSIKPQLGTLLLAGMLVLIIVCANVANLQFARGVTREREVAMRLSLGAGRFRLIRMLLTESAVLAVAGGLLGLLLARAVAGALLSFIVPRFEVLLTDFSPDPRILGFTALLVVLVVAVFGLPPAFRTSSFDLHHAIKTESAGSRGSRAVLRIGRVLVSTQVALCLMVLVTAGVFIQTVRALSAQDPGFERARVITFGFYTVTLGYSGEREQTLYARLQERLGKTPGVQSASLHRYALGAVSRRPCENPLVRGEVGSDFPVGPDFFRTLGLPLIAGREFTGGDRVDGAPVAIIGETLARAQFPKGDAIGASLRRLTPDGAVMLQVIGVSRDFGYAPTDGRAATPCQVFTPVAQDQPEGLGQMTFLVRTNAPLRAMAPLIREAVHDVEPNLAVRDLKTVEADARSQYRERSALAALTSAFGLLALIFAAVGLFGMLSYAVTSRQSELLVRIALGARPGKVVSRVMLEMLTLVAFGAIIGIIASFALVRVTGNFLFGLSQIDPVAVVVALVVMIAIGALSAYAPARRVARLDPAIVLRAQ